MNKNVIFANATHLTEVKELNIEFFEYSRMIDTSLTSQKMVETELAFKQRLTDKKYGDTRPVLLFMEDKAGLGFITGTIYANYGDLENIFVTHTHQRLGIGTELLNEYINICKERKVNKVTTYAYSLDKSAIIFYLRRGFLQVDPSDRPNHIKFEKQI